MSANIETMLYVKEVPWHGLGTKYQSPPNTPEEIIQGAKLGWRVAIDPMHAETHGKIDNWHAIYREDNDAILGVVNSARPRLVQNEDCFNAFRSMIGKTVDTETAASLGSGEKVFGCFKIRNQYKVLDDDVDHYFVVLNEHLKVDGRVTILNTPVRVVCQNTLSSALSTSLYKMRIPVSDDPYVNENIANKIINNVDGCVQRLDTQASAMAQQKVNQAYMDKFLDEMFPFIKVEGESTYSKANETVAQKRDIFQYECMNADNLQNYKGTVYCVYNALLDYTQHYFRSADKAYDLEHRIKLLHGLDSTSESSKVQKFISISKDLLKLTV